MQGTVDVTLYMYKLFVITESPKKLPVKGVKYGVLLFEQKSHILSCNHVEYIYHFNMGLTSKAAGKDKKVSQSIFHK